MFKKISAVVVTSALALTVAACGASTGGTTASTTPTATASTSNVQCVKGSITADGSTALQPLMLDVAKAYQTACSGSSISVQGGGSGQGRTDVSSGKVQIGNSDVFATASATPGLVDHQVAAVVFALIISPDVTVKNLTTQQITDIFTNKVTNWKQVGGPNLPIVVVDRPVGSGTRATFGQYVMNNTAEVTTGHLTASASGDVATAVSTHHGAISYDTLHFAQLQSLHTLSIDGVAPTAANAENNTYKFWNVEHAYTKGQPSGLTQAFLNYMASSDVESIRTQDGFVGLSSMSSAAIAAKQPAQ
ncbi:MAG TPA: phosphate ABC transporter substrate-binding protein [Dictyobacter sp.]|jgi:phosphate transport system substrate-binding protein|nr:phosphate ABC transporter substrate-binding protein [Dictyobacter sp.]